MAHILVIPDSFKGSLSSNEICSIIKEVVVKGNFPHQLILRSVADGGEGSLEAMAQALNGDFINVSCTNHLGSPITAPFLHSKDTAVIELARTAGLNLENRRDILRSSTKGVGEQIKRALDLNVNHIIICLGGSATNDMGLGMAHALGYRFLDKNGALVDPLPVNIPSICSIDTKDADSRLSKISFTCMCDVDNTLFGDNGAARIFAPQKGADCEQIDFLDRALEHMSLVVSKCLDINVGPIKGSGAAGGTAAGAIAFLNASLKKGIDVVLDSIDFNNISSSCDYIFTGEGCLDKQSLSGKVVIGIAQRNALLKNPSKVVAIVGSVDDSLQEEFIKRGIYAVFPVIRGPSTLEEALLESRNNLRATLYNLLKFI